MQSFSQLPLPLLITGISGVAGYNALPYFYAKYGEQVRGVRQTDNWRLRGPGVVVCDAEDRETLSRLFDQYQFRSVLDTAGNCALKSCELDPEMAWRINVAGVENLLTVMAGRDVRYVHLSIDLVYGGDGNGGHIETDPPDPVTAYGKSMVAAEKLILAQRPDAALLRISLPMGLSFNGHAGAIDWIQSRFKKQKPATLYFDEFRTPVFTDCLNELCETALTRDDLQGIYHAGGTRRLSLYQIAQIVNRLGGYDPLLLHGIPRAEAGPMPPRAGNVTLDSSKLAAALGYEPIDPWPLEERWVPTHREWHSERDATESGSAKLLAETLYHNRRRKFAVSPAEFYQKPHRQTVH